MSFKMRKHRCFLSANGWLSKRCHDQYIQKARKMRVRSRAWFKLDQIQNVDCLFYSGMTVVDLGSAPGGWSKYAKKKIGKYGRVVSCDRLPMKDIVGVDFLQGDFCHPNIFHKLITRIQTGKVDIVLSDMCPNISGKADIDLPKLINLGRIALNFCKYVLIPGGSFVVKSFQGEGFDEYFSNVCFLFNSVRIRKPFASYTHSREVYIVAKEYKI